MQHNNTMKEYKEKYPDFGEALKGRRMTLKAPKENEMDFRRELQDLINKHSMENDSNTPDFLLAEYIEGCMNTFAKVMKARDAWYGNSILEDEARDETAL